MHYINWTTSIEKHLIEKRLFWKVYKMSRPTTEQMISKIQKKLSIGEVVEANKMQNLVAPRITRYRISRDSVEIVMTSNDKKHCGSITKLYSDMCL